jgi:hypothetical protein
VGHMSHLMIGFIMGRAAPMSSARFAGIAWKRPVLDHPIRHIKPVAINVHLYTSRGHAVMRGPTITLVAAARAGGIGEARVDVVGFCRKLRPWAEENSAEGKPERHELLPQMLG